jgi:hypothetical protein
VPPEKKPDHFPSHAPFPFTVGQVAAVAEAEDAWPDDDDDPVVPVDDGFVPNDDVAETVLLTVHPASATAITTKQTAMMP